MTRLILILLLLLFGSVAVLIPTIRAYHLKQQEAKALTAIASGNTAQIGQTQQGQAIAREPVLQVSKPTFQELTEPEMWAIQNQTGEKFKRVEEKVTLSLSTISSQKAKLRDTLIQKPGEPGSKPGKVAHFRSAWRSGVVTIVGDTAYLIDTARVKIIRLKTKGKRSRKFLFFRYGPRQEVYQTIIFNPGSRIDTISNLSIQR